MPGSYTADEQSAAKFAGAIADDPDELKAGTVTKTSSEVTALVTHGLSGTPDFIIHTIQADAGSIAALVMTVDGTTITFTIGTAQTDWSVSYIAGYTA